jgi:uroporphyrinogen decarboxylase
VADYPVHLLNWHDRDTAPTLAGSRSSETFRSGPASVVCGGLGRDTLTYGTPGQVVLEAQDAIQQTGGQGLILSTGCVVPVIAPYGNLIAARDAAAA